MVARGWKKVLITKGHEETFWGGKSIILLCRKHSGIDENVKNIFLNNKVEIVKVLSSLIPILTVFMEKIFLEK